ncbi:hypothetical protein HNY73_001364 [Argiope bruennichi]|uniref:Uncharacterized protein n=1 Tax=Argiope bruennichi TaxID=94029 RepID=A0A8T0G729_ARGBR|nr:hypothetical protein HNY73_001364 [Argiope bruennichi]
MSGRRGLPFFVLLGDSGDISDGVSSVILEECFCSRVSSAEPNIDGSEEHVSRGMMQTFGRGPRYGYITQNDCDMKRSRASS